MKHLTHIVCPRAQYSGDYFVTITLPPRHHRKGMKRQKEILDAYIKFIGNNYFEEARGIYEVTQRGILHAHLVVKVREFWEGLQFDSDKSKHNANIKMLSSALTQFSINNVQLIKNLDNVYEYLNKDVAITQKILQSSPYICFKDVDKEIIPLNVHEVENISMDELIAMMDPPICTNCLDE